jgi:hypothetical protein
MGTLFDEVRVRGTETMTGKFVACTNLDHVHINVLGEARTVTIPVELILAVHFVLLRCLAGESSLEIDLVGDDSTGESGWQATLDMGQEGSGAMSPTPWGALVNLANEIP